MYVHLLFFVFFFFKQKTAYEMSLRDWSSDVCSSDLLQGSIQGDHFEIEGGQYAQAHAVNPSTQALGARLVNDHTKSLNDATELATQLGIPVPQTMSEEQRQELDAVEAHTGLHFDDL